ncbi:PD-(D/E)XK nuclease family protein [Thermoanaerobacterium thermosaccharolyticum]|uniref:PD-(D/E)XK nuclease family protein n=1 Tax=Thermoanaerobacterium thermosaccharolyticum TaxID=1517 RepID=UPI00123AC63A|nr:PD-(D/E)XK nuclease family protein [Thermoanaerobacterium thermosaccharolyticum]KAA5808507.1 PD-(D/E)XK nuclease family protein [Thermoanaerobacterium thermosaccharolyticum]
MSNKYISASEINQYLYCPYQWYYEKKYGHKYINELREKSGVKSELSNFKKGIEYHERYYKDIVHLRYKKTALWIFIILALIVIGIGLLKW